MPTDAGALPPPQAPHVYTVVGAGAPMRATGPFAYMSIAATWLRVTLLGAIAVTSFQRTSALRDALAGDADVSVAISLRSRLSTLDRVMWLVILGEVSARALWSRRIVHNAIRRGVRGMRVGVATFAWFVPLFGLRPGIGQLRRAVQAVDYSDHRLVRWLIAAYISFFVSLMVLYVSGGSWQLTNVDNKLNALDTGNQMLTVATVWSVVWAVLASSATLHADRAISSVS